MMRTLTSLTFIYVPREDRVLAAINAGHPDAWSCWLTRRLSLAVLDRATDYLATKSELAQRAPAEIRGELVAFERDAAIAKTAAAMSVTPPAILNQSATTAELGDRLTISQHGAGFRLELRGQGEGGAAAMLKPAELQRILQMLQVEVNKAGWLVAPAKPQAAQTAAAPDTKPVRH
jgi:hypothetical protein